MKATLARYHRPLGLTENSRVIIEPIEIKADLEDDMTVIADAFRLDQTTRLILTSFDARTLEDFSMMTDEDYELMVITAARTGYTLAPLQERKVAILLDWVRTLVKEESVLLNNSTDSLRMTVTEKSIEHCYGDIPLVPPNWYNRFQTDLPMLKNRLFELGETSHSSRIALLFTNLRWVFCFNT